MVFVMRSQHSIQGGWDAHDVGNTFTVIGSLRNRQFDGMQNLCTECCVMTACDLAVTKTAVEKRKCAKLL